MHVSTHPPPALDAPPEQGQAREYLTLTSRCIRRLIILNKTLKAARKGTVNLLSARGHGPPHLQGPKAIGGGADMRHRRRGGRTPKMGSFCARSPLSLTVVA
jgi:hypothetical protein